MCRGYARRSMVVIGQCAVCCLRITPKENSDEKSEILMLCDLGPWRNKVSPRVTNAVHSLREVT